MDDALVKTYKSFVAILVSAKPEYLRPVLHRTAQSLTHRAYVFSTQRTRSLQQSRA